jgi:hypothetical protein
VKAQPKEGSQREGRLRRGRNEGETRVYAEKLGH